MRHKLARVFRYRVRRFEIVMGKAHAIMLFWLGYKGDTLLCHCRASIRDSHSGDFDRSTNQIAEANKIGVGVTVRHVT